MEKEKKEIIEQKKNKEENNKLALFEQKEIRRIWKNNEWYFSVIDVVYALTDSTNPRDYWYRLKQRVSEEEKIELSTICRQLKLTAKDGKKRITDVANTEGILRIIQSIPSPKAEPFKRWLAKVGSERIEEIQDPEIAIKRAKETYLKKGYPERWVQERIFGIGARNKLTDEWKWRGIKDRKDYAILTDEIYKGTFELNTKQLKNVKGIPNQGKHNLRDHMNPIELNLTSLAELTSQEIHVANASYGKDELEEDIKAATEIASNARKSIEKATSKSVVTKSPLLESKKNKKENEDIKNQNKKKSKNSKK